MLPQAPDVGIISARNDDPANSASWESGKMHIHIDAVTLLTFSAVVLLPTSSRPDEPIKSKDSTAVALIGNKEGQIRDDNGLKLQLVWCPPGVFQLQDIKNVAENVEPKDDDAPLDPNESPTQTVRKETLVKVLLSHGYWLGKYEVTQAEWKRIMNTEPWDGIKYARAGADFPATMVSWDDAIEFGQKLTELERDAGRLPKDWEYTLPTEAQWERACRARTTTAYSFGDDASKLKEYAWFFGNALNTREQYAHDVGKKKPNPWGLHDMHGNVCEWCQDTFGPITLLGGRDPQNVSKGPTRTIRGGYWTGDQYVCLSRSRQGHERLYKDFHLGFRLALTSVRQEMGTDERK